MVFALLIFILSDLFACLTGYKESILFSKLGSAAVKWNLHNLFGVERAAVYALPVAAYFMGFSQVDIKWFAVSIASSILAFPFFHDGYYFVGKGQFSEKGIGFTSDSTTSNARLNFNWHERLGLFIISLLLFISGILFIK